MTKRLSIAAAVATALTTSLLAPAGAAAATEFGDNCSGNAPVPTPYTLTTLTAPPGLQLTAPTSGVITEVKLQLGVPLPVAIPEQVKLLRPSGGGNFLVADETTIQSISGLTVADARMPVQAGDQLAEHGLPFSFSGKSFPGYEFYCEAGSDSKLGAIVGDAALSSTVQFTGVEEGRVPLSAVIEPDADHDGYGDETQDKCPASAAVQVACPVIVLDTYVLPSRSKAVVLVSTSTSTPVTVSGVAKLPKAAGKAGVSAQAKLKNVTKTVAPGKLTRFTLNFPAPLKSAVAALAPGNSITVKLQASATDIAGRKATDKAQLKIKG